MDVGQIGGKNSVYIVQLHVKLRQKRIKIVEMRAKSVSWVKIRNLTPFFCFMQVGTTFKNNDLFGESEKLDFHYDYLLEVF